MKKLSLILLLILDPPLMAQERDQDIRINLAALYTQNRDFRGALIWDAPLMFIGPSFTFYNRVTLGAGGISVSQNYAGMHTFSLGLNTFDDNKPGFPAIKLEDKEEDFKNKRGSTFETYLKYDFKIQKLFSFSATYHKDLKRYKGNFIEAKISASVIPFVTIGVGADYGDKSSNKYAYGPEGVSGIGSTEQFVSIMLPFLPFRGRLILNLSQSSISKSKNSTADYVRGNKHNSNFSAIATWSF